MTEIAIETRSTLEDEDLDHQGNVKYVNTRIDSIRVITIAGLHRQSTESYIKWLFLESPKVLTVLNICLMKKLF